MTTTHTLSLDATPVDAEALGYFRFGTMGKGVIATNEYGEWHHFEADAFRAFLKGAITPDDDAYAPLAAKGFVRDAIDLDLAASAMRRRKKHVGMGPALHVLHLGLAGSGLTVETAKDIIDFAMLSTSAALTFRLRAEGAPDLDILGFICQYTTEKNRYEGKTLTLQLEADPALLDADACAWLIDKRFHVRTSVSDGTLTEGTISGIGRLNEAAAARKRQGFGVHVDVTLDTQTAPKLADLTAALASHGVASMRLHPSLRGEHALDLDGWRSLHRATIDTLLGGESGLIETLTANLVSRIQDNDPTPDPALSSPSGVATGQAIYDLHGRIFPSLTALSLPNAEDYVIGTAGEVSYREAVSHPTLKMLAMASLLECLPGFADHWATPYIGIDPTVAIATRGDAFVAMPTAIEAAAQVVAVENIFQVLTGSDGARTEALTGWAR